MSTAKISNGQYPYHIGELTSNRTGLVLKKWAPDVDKRFHPKFHKSNDLNGYISFLVKIMLMRYQSHESCLDMTSNRPNIPSKMGPRYQKHRHLLKIRIPIDDDAYIKFI